MTGQAMGPLSVSGEASSAAVEPPDSEPEGPVFVEMDPSGRFGRFNEVLGRGACKVVYKAFDVEEGTEMAWNQVRGMEFMNGKDGENREERERIFAEVRVLKALKHKNIMSFRDSWYDPRQGTINFITELFTSGTLRQYRRRHRQLDPEVLKGWAWQILCGLVYLHGHSPPIIHRDLKCDNIFINGSDGVVKIGDLGLATLLRQRTAPQSVLGTPEFMAPELYEEEYDDRVDVYSFGMCLLELATMEYPYSECKNAAQIYRKVSLGIRPAGLQKVPPGELHQLINVCLLPREQRPRARTLLKHPFFESIRAVQGSLASARSEAALAAAVGAPGELASRAASATSDYAAALAQGPLPAAEGSLQSNASDWRLNDIIEEEVAREGGREDAREGSREGSRDGSRALRAAPPRSPQRVLSPDVALSPRSGPSRTVSAASSHASSAVSAFATGEAAEVEPGGSGTPGPAGRTIAVLSPQRRFAVVGKFREEQPEEYALRLRIAEPGGGTRTVEFSFDLSRDTAMSVAAEMVEELALSPADAADIAAAIREEIAAMSSDLEATLSMNLEAAGEALRAGILHSANSANGSVALAVDGDGSGGNGASGSQALVRGGGGSALSLGDASSISLAGGISGVSVGENSSSASLGGAASGGAAPIKLSPLGPGEKPAESVTPALDADGAPLTLDSRPALERPAPSASDEAPSPPFASVRRPSPPPLVVRRSTSYETGGLSSGGSGPLSTNPSAGARGEAGFDLRSPPAGSGSSSGEATPHLGGAPAVLSSRASLTELAAAARAALLASGASGESALRRSSASPQRGAAGSPGPAEAGAGAGAPPKLQALRQLFEEQQRGQAAGGAAAPEMVVRLAPALSPRSASPQRLLARVSAGLASARPPLSPTGSARRYSAVAGDDGDAPLRPSRSFTQPARERGPFDSLDLGGRRLAEADLEVRRGAAPLGPSVFAPVSGHSPHALTPRAAVPTDPAHASVVEALDLAAGSPRQLEASGRAASLAPGAALDAFSVEAFGAAAAGFAPGAEAPALFSAPASSLVSREPSPQRELNGLASGSAKAAKPTPAAVASLPAATKDKELLRKAAADAMKAVELRALNLLEGGVGGALGARGGVRGTPMAACRAVGAPGAVPIAAAAGPPLNLQGPARSEPILRTDGLGGSGSSAGAP